ncbi:MAG: hypothetical protein WBM13_07635 [Bacteroidia bacterium]
MKKAALLSILLFFSIIGCKSQKPSTNELMVLNDRLMNKVTKCWYGERDVFDAYETGDSIKGNNEVQRFFDTCKQFIYEIEKMKVDKDLESLKTAFWGVIVEYYSLEDNYKKLGRILIIPESRRSAEEKKLSYKLANQIAINVNDARISLKKTQREYNDKYKVVLKGSEKN